jgi:hypothetical protein
MRCTDAYRFGAASFAAGNQAIGTDCSVVCSCGGQEDVVVEVRYGFDLGVEIRVSENPPPRQLVEDRAVHLPGYDAGSICLHAMLGSLRLRD